MIFMILSFPIEPGIIPRKKPQSSKSEEKDKKEIINNGENVGDKKEKVEKEYNQNIKEENYDEDISYIFTERKCTICNIILPPGASHYRVCDNCAQDFDHHCNDVSKCIGKRNHKIFYFFLFSGTI